MSHRFCWTQRSDPWLLPLPRGEREEIGSFPSPKGRGWTATGAFTSRRGPGEGSVSGRGRIRQAGFTAIGGRQAVPLQVVGLGLALPSTAGSPTTPHLAWSARPKLLNGNE